MRNDRNDETRAGKVYRSTAAEANFLSAPLVVREVGFQVVGKKNRWMLVAVVVATAAAAAIVAAGMAGARAGVR